MCAADLLLQLVYHVGQVCVHTVLVVTLSCTGECNFYPLRKGLAFSILRVPYGTNVRHVDAKVRPWDSHPVASVA